MRLFVLTLWTLAAASIFLVVSSLVLQLLSGLPNTIGLFGVIIFVDLLMAVASRYLPRHPAGWEWSTLLALSLGNGGLYLSTVGWAVGWSVWIVSLGLLAFIVGTAASLYLFRIAAKSHA